MKTSAEKTATTNPTTVTQAKSQPFFTKAGEAGFFGAAVQAKLTMGSPGDKFEREADGMADKVVKKTESGLAPQKCAACEERDKAQRKPLADAITPFVQRKEESVAPQKCATCEEKKAQLKPLEVHAAPAVQRKEGSPSPRGDDKEQPVQMKLGGDAIQKSEEKEEVAQAKTTGGAVPGSTASVEGSLSATKGQGSPLPDATRSDMEAGFGVDFGNVRIHTGSNAVNMSKDLHAQAFTHGNDIYFNDGKFNPASTEGKILLAHELTHTVQQGASVQRKPEVASGAAPLVQRKEENEDLQKELAQSDKAAKDAVDPGPALKTRAQAAEVQAQTAKKAQGKHAKKKGSGGKKTGSKGNVSAAGKKARAAAMAAQEDALKKQLGTVGKDLSDASAFACAKADEKATNLAENEQTHDNADQKQQQTDGAVVPPTQEGQALSNTEQVAGLDAAAPPQTDKEAARRTMTASLGEAMPTSIEAVNEFESQGKAQVVGNQVLGAVSADVGAVQDKYNDIEQPAAPKPVEESTALPAEEVAPVTPSLHLGKGAVPALQPQHTNVKAFDQQSDNLLQSEGISDEQLNMVDTGDLAEANKERKGLKKKTAEEPSKIQKEAKSQTLQVEKDLQQEEVKGKSQMRQKRKGGLNDTRGKQQKTKSDLEKKREEVTAKINGIYERAKKSVTNKLSNLEKLNLVAFDVGQQVASTTFEREVKRDISVWKVKRYSGVFGGVKWLRDALLGIDEFPEVKQALTRGRENYIKRIDTLIVAIDKENQRVIKECKQELANAQQEIQDYVKKLGPALKSTGQAALKEMKSKLAEMDKFIDEQKDKLREKLCSKREEAIKAIDKKIEKMKEEMSGALSKLGNLILEALVKFFKWALEKAGYSSEKLMEIINKGKVVLKKIVTSPGEFFGNLAKAVKGGVDNFKNNIQKHLIAGVVGWLTGAMSDAGLQLPTTWDVKGIFFLLLQILSLTKDAIFKKLGDKIGRPIVDAAMNMAGFVKRVVDEGPMALWDMLKEQAETLKEKVMETIRNWISMEMIKQGVIKLVSMLNPVGAIVQLIIGIYNAVMFFVENWSRIVEFVKTVFGSIADIALGRLGGAMTAIEKALGMTIPIILNFIARLLGLSGIGKAIRKAIDTVRAPIDKIVDKGLEIVGKVVKGVVGKVKGVVKKGDKKKKGKEQIPEKLGKTITFKTEKETHKLYVKRVGNTYKSFVESTPEESMKMIGDFKSKMGEEKLFEGKGETKKKIKDEITAAENALKVVNSAIKPAEGQVEAGKQPTLSELERSQIVLSTALRAIAIDFEHLETGGDKFGTFEKPYEIVWHKVPTSAYPVVSVFDYQQQKNVALNPEAIETVHILMTEEASVLKNRIKEERKRAGDASAQLFFLMRRFKNPYIRERMLNKIEAQLKIVEAELTIAEAELLNMKVLVKQGKRPGIAKKERQIRNLDIDKGFILARKDDVENYEKEKNRLISEIDDANKTLGMLSQEMFTTQTISGKLSEKFVLGIAPKYRIIMGKTIGPKPSSDDKDARKLQSKFREIMESGGFSMSSYDADHATDLSLGGNDLFDNLWPIKINPAPDQMINIETGKDTRLLGSKQPGAKITTPSFYKAYFKIVKTQ
jgi:hypothetical protein